MLPLVDRPLLAYTFEHLRRHGVRRAIVSCGYLPTQIRDHFGSAYGELALDYEVEDEPLGTGGAIGFAARNLGETFFALNGDSLVKPTSTRFSTSIARAAAKATIMLTPVADPSRYGLVRLAPTARSRRSSRSPARGDRHEPDQRRALRARAEVLELIPAGAGGLDRAGRVPAAVRRGLGLRARPCPATGSTSARPPRICRLTATSSSAVPHRGRGRARQRLHARRRDRAGARGGPARARRSSSGRAQSSSAGACVGSLAVVGAGAIIGAAGHRRVVGRRQRVRPIGGEASIVIGSILGGDAQLGDGCHVLDLAVVGPGARLAVGNVLDHGLRARRRRRDPGRRR